MKDQTYATLQEMETTADHVYHRIHALLNAETKMSIEELGMLTDIMKDCSETIKNICKIMHHSSSPDASKRI